MKALINRIRTCLTPLLAFLLCWLCGTRILQAQSLQILPQTLDLGAVRPGIQKEGEIILINPGENELKVEAILIGEQFTVSPPSMQLLGGERSAVKVLFEARQEGEYEAELLLQVKGFLKTEKFPVPLRALVAQARLTIDPDPSQGLDMGALEVGETARRTIVLGNPGAVGLTIDAISLAEADSAFQLTAPEAVSLAPGETVELQIDFHPRRGGTHQDRLVVSTPDLTPSRLEIAIAGQGLAPRAQFSPIPEVGMVFGELELGKTRTLDLTVLNQGRADLRIDALEISSGAFITTWDPTSAQVLPADERLQIPISFRPRYEGRASARLLIRCNDPEHPEVEIPLLGAALQSPPQIELLNEDVIDFGNVAIGKDERDHLLVWNQGGTPFTVTMDLEGPASGEFELETASVLLQPGEFRKASVKFIPRERGECSADLLVETDSGTRSIELQGVGKFLELTPISLDFDRVVVGKSSNLQAEIFNFGNADFTITNIVPSDPKVFAIQSQVSPANKFILPADGLRPLPISVTFSPPARGVFNGVLQLQGYWDEAFETREILLSGTGIAADIELHPAGPFAFDYVVLGQTETQTIVATNTGDTDLQVEAHPESPEAAIEPDAFTLQPGQSTSLQLTFQPQALGKRDSRVRLISNAVKEKALPLQVTGQGGLDNVDLERVTSVIVSRKTQFDTLKVRWNNTPVVLHDQTKVDLVFKIPEDLRQAMIGRKFFIEWTKLDHNYDEQGGPSQLELQIQDAGETHVLAEMLNLRLLESGNKRVRLKISTQNHPNAPLYSISQIFEAGGWKFEFEAKPLVSFFSIRPARTWTDAEGIEQEGETERLIGLPGIAFFGWHNAENQSVSGIHLTAIGNVLEALSTENSLAVSLGIAVSFYKDRFMFGIGRDVYDHRSKEKRKGTQDYIMTFKYWGLQK